MPNTGSERSLSNASKKSYSDIYEVWSIGKNRSRSYYMGAENQCAEPILRQRNCSLNCSLQLLTIYIKHWAYSFLNQPYDFYLYGFFQNYYVWPSLQCPLKPLLIFNHLGRTILQSKALLKKNSAKSVNFFYLKYSAKKTKDRNIT